MLTAKQMAYGGNGPSQLSNDPQMFRLRRGNLPVNRAGKPVTSVPRFRGITLYSQTSTNAPAPFATTNSNTVIKWPTKSST